MTRRVALFWGGALGAALAFAAAAALLLPFEALGLESRAERERAWLLTVWTGGVMAVLFGASSLLGALAPLGFREVHEAGSVTRAAEMRREAAAGAGGFHSNLAWWLVATGVLLVAVYFAAWLTGAAPSL